MKKILITGGSGYIGSHTIVELLTFKTKIFQEEYDIISIDNQCNSSTDAFTNIQKICGDEKIKNYCVDLCNLNDTDTVFKENEIVGIIHFAAYKSVGESVKDPLKYYFNNITSLINLLHLCEKYNVNNFIFSSSCSVYGNVPNDELPVTEKTLLRKAQSPYAFTKQIGETIIEDFCKARQTKLFTFNAILLRYFNPVGAHPSGLIGEDPINVPNSLLPLITLSAVGKNEKTFTIHGSDYETRDGTCIRDYVHVCDIAYAHILALNKLLLSSDVKKNNGVTIYNLGNGDGVTVKEIITTFEHSTGIKLKYEEGPRREGDVMSIYSNCLQAQKELLWNCKYNTQDMMTTAYHWQKNNKRT
jgi:UDP-glucose 4-epimerase